MIILASDSSLLRYSSLSGAYNRAYLASVLRPNSPAANFFYPQNGRKTIVDYEVSGRIIYGNISEIGKDYIAVEDLKLKITERTNIRENGGNIAIDDLRVGDYVRIDCTDNFEAFSIHREHRR